MYLAVNVDNGSTRLVNKDEKVTENFRFSEIACEDRTDVILYSKRHMDLVQAIRDIVGPLSISSAFRTPEHNKVVGGVVDSQHQFGIAVDMKLPNGYTIDEFKEVVLSVTGSQVGIGLYKSFIHMDLGRPRIWDER